MVLNGVLTVKIQFQLLHELLEKLADQVEDVNMVFAEDNHVHQVNQTEPENVEDLVRTDNHDVNQLGVEDVEVNHVDELERAVAIIDKISKYTNKCTTF